MTRLSVRPITLREANRYVQQHHRHSAAVKGCLFCVQVVKGDRVCGVAIMGRPVAQALQDKFTCEILRVCVDGTPNAATKAYGALCRAAQAIGYRKAITYTLEREPGTSLRAAGFHEVATSTGGSWVRTGNARSRSGAPLLEAAGLADPRRHDKGAKVRWERVLSRSTASTAERPITSSTAQDAGSMTGCAPTTMGARPATAEHA